MLDPRLDRPPSLRLPAPRAPIPSRGRGPALALFPTLIVAGAAACAGEAVRDGHPRVDEVPALALVEELRIGSLDDPDHGFSNIGPIQVEPSGEVFVQESTDRQIRLYDAEGRLVRTYGRQGDGPGEFRTIYGFGVAGDTLWVSDGTLRRLTLFSRSGTLLGTVSGSVDVPLGNRPTGPPFTLAVYPNSLDPEGRIVGRATPARYPNLADSVVNVPVIHFGADGSVLDTLALIPTVVSFEAIEVSHPSTSGVTSYLRVDPPALDSGTYRTAATATGDSVLVSWAVTGTPPRGLLTTERTGAMGTAWSVVLAYDPRPVDPAYLDSIADARPRGLRLSPADSVALVRTARSVMRTPPHHVPVAPPSANESGGAWVRLDGPPGDAGRWLVLGANGEIRGIAELPVGALIRWKDEERVWVVERDAFEVPWLVRYRLVDPGRP